jgi:DNA-binding transcriptional MerR regulator
MNECRLNYLTTGEFAKLCKVKKQTLFHYDQIGLLSPILKDSKGYRYYSIRQLELFNVISLLKDLGMSLNEIQQYTLNKSPEKFLSIMHQQKKEMTKQREIIDMNEKIIDAKIKLMEGITNVNFDQITLKNCPMSALYLSKNIQDIPSEKLVEAVSDFYDELHRHQLNTGYSLGYITKREQILKGEYRNYSYLYMKQPHPKEGYPYFHMVQGGFLVGYHRGGDRTVQCTYNRLLENLNYLNLSLGEYVFEECIYKYVVKNQEEDFITKIMIQVV